MQTTCCASRKRQQQDDANEGYRNSARGSESSVPTEGNNQSPEKWDTTEARSKEYEPLNMRRSSISAKIPNVTVEAETTDINNQWGQKQEKSNKDPIPSK